MSPRADQQRDLLRLLGTEVLPVEEPEGVEARRERVSAHMASVMRREGERKVRRRNGLYGALAALAVAAAVLLVIGWRGTRSRTQESQRGDHVAALSGPVLLLHAGATAPVGTQSSLIARSDEIRTEAGGRARLDLAMGASVLVSPETRVRVASDSEVSTAIDLPEGRIEVEVPKLGPARELRVRTRHADVVVHGTRFVVEVGAVRDGVAPTSVSVVEGRVGVWSDGREVILEQGARWANVAEAAEPPSSSPPAVLSSAPPARSADVPRTGGAASPASTQAAAASTLLEENRLFQQALEARRRGNLEEAIRQLDVLLTRYPGSTLAQEARVERIRCLKQLGRDQVAAEEARKYLAEHPNGFAKEEARDMALPPAPSSSR